MSLSYQTGSLEIPPTLAKRPSDNDLDEFVITLKTQIEIFVNRMKSNSSRGRPIANDSSVQNLFMNAMSMHSKLLRYIQDQEDCRVYYEGLQDKLTQVKDARAALDALREEEKERLRREAEEAERIRQIQMREKLELMRQKKQEYLQYQRQVALQRMQEQEREMLLRQEHAKHQYMMMQQQQQHQFHPALYGVMPGAAPPQMVPNPYQPYLPPVSGQFQPIPTSSISYMTQPGLSQGSNTVNMNMPPVSTSAEPLNLNLQQQQTGVASSFNVQGLSMALPSYPQMMARPYPQHQSSAMPNNPQQQQPQPGMVQQQQSAPQYMPQQPAQELIFFD